jgi:hypothetical protein
MRIMKKTRWLLPVLIIGLAALVVIEPSISASDRPLPDATLGTEGMATGLEPATANAETPGAKEAESHEADLGTY